MAFSSEDSFAVSSLFPSMKMMELFAGIGGMRSAAEAAGFHLAAVQPYEINPSALLAYSHNFPGSDEANQPLKPAKKKVKPRKAGIKARNLLGMLTEEWDGLKTDLVTMSPPCQPFTRQGLQLDTSDPRSKPLAHILQLLSTAHHLPPMLLLENVKGFETSAARAQVVKVISERGYLWREFLLCPSQLGVPNSRLRYYLLAVLPPSSPGLASRDEQIAVDREFPVCLCLGRHQNATPEKCLTCKRPVIAGVRALLDDFHSSHRSSNGITEEDIDSFLSPSTYADTTPTLEQFLRPSPKLEASLQNPSLREQREIVSKKSEKLEGKQENSSDSETPELVSSSVTGNPNQSELSHNQQRNWRDKHDLSQFELKPKVLAKYAMLLDVVDNSSRRTCCFTKGYGRLVEGTGSVYNPRGKAELDAAFQNWLKENNAGDRSLRGQADGSVGLTSVPCGGVLTTGDVTSGTSCATLAGIETRKIIGVHETGFNHTAVECSSANRGNDECFRDFASSTSASEKHFSLNKNVRHESLSGSFSTKDKEHLGKNCLDETDACQLSLLPLLSLKLRHFTPAECLRLMCFSSSFSFPSTLTHRQQYQLIGNSINVLVVTVLLMYLLHWRRLVQQPGDHMEV